MQEQSKALLIICVLIHDTTRKDTLREMWDKQKIIPKDGGSLANMLDHPEFMESIRDIKEK